jgi:lycopene cyclase domain-containing protein
LGRGATYVRGGLSWIISDTPLIDRFQYLLLMAACLVVTAPLEVVYRAGVWRRPVRLAQVLAVPVLVFAVWDALAIRAHIWSFSARYTTGWHLPFDLPVEEVAFFVVIPICSILAYEAVRRSLGDD